MKTTRPKGWSARVAAGAAALAATGLFAAAVRAASAAPAALAQISATAIPAGKLQARGERFWTTHPQAWPCASLCLGHFAYNKADLAYLLRLPREKDASLRLVAQLVAAKLNLACGLRSTEAERWVWQADAYLATQDALPLAEPVDPAGALGRQLTDLAAKLESFNAVRAAPGP